MFRQSTNQNYYAVLGQWVTSLDGINDRSIQTLLRGENDSKETESKAPSSFHHNNHTPSKTWPRLYLACVDYVIAVDRHLMHVTSRLSVM